MHFVHTAPAHHKTVVCIPRTIKRTTDDIVLFKDCDVFTENTGIVNQVFCTGKRGNTAAYQIDFCGFRIGTFYGF